MAEKRITYKIQDLGALVRSRSQMKWSLSLPDLLLRK